MATVTLTDQELGDAAQAARLAARQAQKDAATRNPTNESARRFAADAERHNRLAVKFDAARQFP